MPSNNAFVRTLHAENASLPRLVSDLGKVTLLRPQELNALNPMVVRLLESVIEENEQEPNEYAPILVTPFGITRLVNPEH